MAATAWPRDIWNHWAIQILVIFILGLQIALFLFAGIRRRGGHPVLRFLLWLAYQLADCTATYALGHLSLAGAAGAHPIVAFWASFLLLHLGGPDNITASSLEDNELWKRHLLNAILQVSGAVYVLYEYYRGHGHIAPACLHLDVGHRCCQVRGEDVGAHARQPGQNASLSQEEEATTCHAWTFSPSRSSVEGWRIR